MGQKKWLETEQSVSDILKLKPGLDFDQEEKEMRIQRIMNLAAFNWEERAYWFWKFSGASDFLYRLENLACTGNLCGCILDTVFRKPGLRYGGDCQTYRSESSVFLWNDCSGAGHDFNSVSGEVFPVSDV